MKHLLLSLSVLALLASCGKDNKVASAAPAASSSNPITINDATATSLGTLIDTDSSFPAAPAAYYKYYYGTTQAASAASNCTTGTKWGIPYYICNSGSSNYSNVTQSSVYVSSIDVTTKRNELKAIINSSTAGYISQVGSTTWLVRTQAGMIYTISTAYPLTANPVQIQQANGQITYFMGVAQ